ncbi:MAG: class II fructose-bisphosphate aldolase [Spirochaetia bacterium]|jgi:fructose-bisphosphate aldolase class II
MLSLKQAIDQLNAKYPRSAIGAFNFNDMTDMQGVMRAGIHTRQPCIIMASAAAVSYMGIHFVREMHRAANMTSPVPLYLMLDHSDSVETCTECIDNGFSLVMYDGSALPFDENVRRTREVVRVAHARGVLVEAEIGRLPGREEHLDVKEMDALLTDPREAKAFWEQAGADLLAISFGTAHGFYKSQPRLNFEVIRATRELTDAPLVMHGGTGVSDEDLRTAIGCGVKKVNIGTELKHAYTTAMRESLARMDGEIDPRKILGPAREAVQRAVEGRLAVLCTPRVEEMV